MSAQSRRSVAASGDEDDSINKDDDAKSTFFDLVRRDMTLTGGKTPTFEPNNSDNTTTPSFGGFSLTFNLDESGEITLFVDLAPPIPSNASGYGYSGRNDITSITSSSGSLGSLPSLSKRKFGDEDSGYSDTSDTAVSSKSKRRMMKRNRPSANLSEGAGSLGERHPERHLDPLLAKHRTKRGFVSEDPKVVDQHEQESNARDSIVLGGEKPINNPASWTQLAFRRK